MRPLSRTLLRSGLVTLVVAGMAGGPAAIALAHNRPAATAGHTPTAHTDEPGTHHKKPAPVPAPPGVGDDVPGVDLGWWPYRNLIHGSFVVESKKHTVVQVVVQRGTVTALGDHSVTVTSGDKVVMTWTTTNDTRDVSKGKRHSKSIPLAVGASVGIWGSGTTDAATATVILIRSAGKETPTPAPSPSPSVSPTPTPSPTPSS